MPPHMPRWQLSREIIYIKVDLFSYPVFTRLIARNVPPQTRRVCVCPYYKREKFAAQSLVINWCRLREEGSPGTCHCCLCTNDGWASFVPRNDVRSITGVGDFCDKLLSLCAPEPIFEFPGYQHDNGLDGMNDGDSTHDGFLRAHRREKVRPRHRTFLTCSTYVINQYPRHHQTAGEIQGK